jgi:flavodoxin
VRINLIRYNMKNYFLAMAACAAVALTGCSSKTATTTEQQDEPADKVLVLYYSQTGVTKTVAEELQRQLGADIAEIEAVNPYPDDYDATITRWRQELTDSVKPGIKPLKVNLDDYSTIFLGFPIWGGTYALPIATFVSQNPLKDKTVVTFATFGSGGIGSATADLQKALPEAKVVRGYGVRASRIDKAQAEITRFLIEGGYVDGEIEPLPEYSEQQPVTDDDVKVFNDACSGYRFPLGEPVTVGKRQTPDGVDYKYDVNSKMPDGTDVKATIYVTVPNGQAPEFTLVER